MFAGARDCGREGGKLVPNIHESAVDAAGAQLKYRSARAYVKGDLGRAGNFMMIIWVV